MKARPAACFCCPAIGFVCSLHRDGGHAQSIEEADALDDERRGIDCPWNPDALPERLKGYGHRMADQDGGDGEDWVTPQEDLEAQMIEAAKVLLDASEI